MGRRREILERLAKTLQIRHVLVRQGLAECLGTLVLVVSEDILSFWLLFFFFIIHCYIMQDTEGFSFWGATLKIGTQSEKCYILRLLKEKHFEKIWPCLSYIQNIGKLHGLCVDLNWHLVTLFVPCNGSGVSQRESIPSNRRWKWHKAKTFFLLYSCDVTKSPDQRVKLVWFRGHHWKTKWAGPAELLYNNIT